MISNSVLVWPEIENSQSRFLDEVANSLDKILKAGPVHGMTIFLATSISKSLTSISASDISVKVTIQKLDKFHSPMFNAADEKDDFSCLITKWFTHEYVSIKITGISDKKSVNVLNFVEKML